MGSSKGTTQTSQVTIPPAVLAQYSAVNAKANQVDSQPFQAFTGEAVAPVNAQQQSGIAATNTAANSYQPYTNAATAYTVAGGQAVNPNQLDINKYLSPYLNDVVGSESALLNQNNQQQQSGQLGTAIQSGAFGGDRAGIAAANLAGQQNLTNANIYSNLLNQGYNTALSTAQQQQGVGLAAGQANRAATQQTGQSLANLGAQTQGLGLAGAQAQIGAGNLEQQTQQAQDTFNAQQWAQQQSLPYQQLQQQADISEGIGANSGSTTTTNSVANGIFSDERLKDDIRKIGKTFDGQDIYSYRYKGDKHTQIGLMAQNVEHKHPEAVGLAAGYKTVDYKKATDKAAERGHFAAGGSLPYDGTPTVTDMMANHFQQMYGGLLTPQASIVPQASHGAAQLHPAQGGIPQGVSPAQQATDYANAATAINKAGTGLGAWGKPRAAPIDTAPISYDPATDAQANLADQYSVDQALGRADGGTIPYGGDSLDIPDEQNQYQLHPAQGSTSAPQDNTLKDIGQVAQIAAMFAAKGGRIERADGGEIDIDSLLKQLQDTSSSEDSRVKGEIQDANSSDDEDTTNAPNNSNSHPMGDSGPKKVETSYHPSGRPGTIDPDVVSFLSSHGVSGDVAKGIAAGINAESGNKISARNPTSGALGLGQWLGPRLNRLKARFGENPGKAEQLQFLLEELKGGDRGGPPVLGSKTSEEALQNYVTKFMRPKAGYETDRDIGVGLGALRGHYADGGAPDIEDVTDPNSDEARRRFNEQFDSTIGNNQNPQPDAATPAAPNMQMGEPSTYDVAAQNNAYSQQTPGVDPLDYHYPTNAAKEVPNVYADPQQGAYALDHRGFFDDLKHGKTDAVLSLLSGLSAAATANTKNPLTAAFTGLGAGAQAMQGQRAFEQQRAQQGQDLAIRQGQLGIQGALAGYQGAQVPGQIAERAANVGAIKATTLASLQHAAAESQTNSTAAVNYAVLLRNDLANGIITQEDAAKLPAPINMGGGTVSTALPEMASVKPAPAVTAPTQQPTPINPGEGLSQDFYNTDPDATAAKRLRAQADAVAIGNPPMAASLRAQAEDHQRLAEARYESRVAPNVATIQKNAGQLSSYASDVYPQIKQATQSALTAANSANLNTDSPEWGKVWGRIGSVLPGVVPGWASTLQGASEVASRNRALLNGFNVKGTGIGARAESVELNALNKYGTNAPGPAGGFDSAIKTAALADQHMDYAKWYAEHAPNMKNESQESIDWIKAHPLESYIDKNVQESPFARGMTKEQISSYVPEVKSLDQAIAHFGNGNKYGKFKGQPFQLVKNSKGKIEVWPIGE